MHAGLFFMVSAGHTYWGRNVPKPPPDYPPWGHNVPGQRRTMGLERQRSGATPYPYET